MSDLIQYQFNSDLLRVSILSVRDTGKKGHNYEACAFTTLKIITNYINYVIQKVPGGTNSRTEKGPSVTWKCSHLSRKL